MSAAAAIPVRPTAPQKLEHADLARTWKAFDAARSAAQTEIATVRLTRRA